ncbi:sensor histidine kinase [Streptomyces sp. NPDC002573]|uniref:sensor histidine kinase n=1 Tax=Streptomyces sp. NPDC002573 TaxID=3364651 RepID=UPI0036CC16BC
MPAVAVALAAALLAESVALSVAVARRPRLPGWVGAADTAVSCAALALNAALVTGPPLHTWGFFAYPYSLVASCACGLLLRTAWQVGAASVALAVVDVVSDHLASGQPLWNAIPNAGSYLGIGPVTWLVARELRRMAAELDASRALALELARAGAVAEERTKQSRLLHDRVLQTLETLAHGRWVADTWMRDQVRAEAGWLRWLIDHGPDAVGAPATLGAADLATGLHALAQARIRQGLKVSVYLPPEPEAHFVDVPRPVTDALLAACHEALTNVRKHAGTDRATVAAAVEARCVVVSVVDQGRGFAPAERREGIGLARSIRGRLTEIGGTVEVSSAPGEGTVLEMRVPLAP